MQNTTKYFLVTLFVLIAIIQLGHTVFNQVNWPFCSHNFYYHRSPLVKDLFRIALIDNQGNKVVMDPRHVLPIEGYRCGSVFREVFVKNQDLGKKNAFSKLILERLNSGGWNQFDERFSPARPLNGNHFVELTIEKHWIDTRQYPVQKELVVTKKDTLFHYSKAQ